MGTVITPELLKEIKSKEIPAKKNQNNFSNSNEIKNESNQNFSKIIYNIYSPFYKKQKNFCDNNQKELIINSNNIDIIDENNKIKDKEIIKSKNVDEEMNDIIFRKHKSFDLSNNYLYKDLFLDDNINNNKIIDSKQKKDYKNEDIFSEKDNESNNSDYADLTKAISNFNKDKNKNTINNNNKISNQKELNSNKIRDSYYNKLIIKNLWNPLKKYKNLNHIFFFDWDDTLLCTTYLLTIGALNEGKIGLNDQKVLNNLDLLVSNLLSKSLDFGHVFLITNGAPGWVELSSSKFYPKTSIVLTRVKIISARGLCEKKLPGDMRQWKTKAFKYALDSLQIKKNNPTNILCFGDSNIEIEASYTIRDYFYNAYLKTIKLKESPSHIELEKELKVIYSQLDSFLTNFKNLSIKVGRKRNE